jgi:hypothetical protein
VVGAQGTAKFRDGDEAGVSWVGMVRKRKGSQRRGAESAEKRFEKDGRFHNSDRGKG